MFPTQDIVDKQQLIQNFDKTQVELKKLADKYKNLNKEEAPKVDAFQTEAMDRWKKVTDDISRTRPILEDVITAWKSYNACVDVLTVWQADGEKVMDSGNAEAIQEFFKDVDQYEERLRTLNDSGNFLLSVATDPVAEEIKSVLEQMNQKCPEMMDSYQQFEQTEVIGRARSEYEEGVEGLSSWLQGAEAVLNEQIPCIHAPLKEHLLQLDVSVFFASVTIYLL